MSEIEETLDERKVRALKGIQHELKRINAGIALIEGIIDSFALKEGLDILDDSEEGKDGGWADGF